MAIINNLDLGAHTTWQAPFSTRRGTVWGAEAQSLIVEGGQSVIFDRSGMVRKRTETIWVSSPAGETAAKRLVRQVQELAGNPGLQPVFIQWASGGGNILIDSEDGWYILETVTPDLEVTIDGIIPITIVVAYVAPSTLARALAMSWLGSPAAVGWQLNVPNPVANWLAFPINAAGIPFQVRRFGAEGYIPVSYQLPASVLAPELFYPSATISDLWKGRVAVYDTINTSANPIPTGGSFINANWNEVLHPDHSFVGDCVITNGLLLLLFQVGAGANALATIYFWNITSNIWQNFGTLSGSDSNASGWTLRSITLGRVGHRESSIRLDAASNTSNWISINIRVIAGTYFVRLALRQLTQTNTRGDNLTLLPVIAPKITWNENQMNDNTLAADQVNIPSGSQFGYTAAFATNSGAPFFFGWLYLDNTGQSTQGNILSTGLGVGDLALPAINNTRFYGFFITPFLAPQSLQAEAESGTLGTGWSSVADALASGGNAARAISGTVSGNANTFGAAWIPPSGAYSIYFRIRVASNASALSQMQLGLWDVNSSVFLGSNTYSPSFFGTSYAGVLTLSSISLTVGRLVQFRAQTTATLATDWFIDEAILVPINLPAIQNAPRDLFQQFAFDRATRMVAV
jgi:hypothetical protein